MSLPRTPGKREPKKLLPGKNPQGKTVKVVLEFSEDDLNTILQYAYFDDDEPWTVESLKKARLYQRFIQQLRASADNFVMEIVDGSEDACANDWMREFSGGPAEGFLSDC